MGLGLAEEQRMRAEEKAAGAVGVWHELAEAEVEGRIKGCRCCQCRA
jgi:hypothetical protein